MDITKTFTFVHRTKVVCGLGAADKIADELAALGCKTPFIVTDTGIIGAGILEPILASLKRAGLPFHVFDEVQPNPLSSTVDKGTAQAKQGGFDSVIAVGGGSSIDTGKAIAMLVTNNGTLADWEGVERFKIQPLPLVTVPTTIGTGSEVTRGAVITDPVRKVKMVVVGVMLFPTVAILDPMLLTKLPGKIAASSGLDSLTQAIEAYISINANPIADALNIAAVKLIAENLRAAVAGNNLEALLNMQVGTTIEGIGFHNAGLGMVHAMANTVGAYFNTSHGITNAVILPYVLEFNMIANVKKYAELARAMGEKTEQITDRQAAAVFIEAVKTLSKDIGIPQNLRDIGVTEDSLPAMAHDTLSAPDIFTNPRRYSEPEILEIFKKAY
jgi:alcohol dehydrogenase class IV